MATDQVNGFFILPSVNSTPGTSRDAAIKVTLVKNSISPIANDVVAALDTGSTVTLIDEDLARDGNLEFVQEQIGMSGIGASRKIKTYKCGIFIEEFKQLINLECGALPFKRGGKNFLVLLGMDFIKHFDLQIKAGEKEILLSRPTP